MKIDGLTTKAYVSNPSATSNQEDVKVHRAERIGSKEQQDEQQRNLTEETDKKQLTHEDAEHIVNGMNEFLQPHLTSLSFQLHDDTNRFYVEVIDQATDKVIREIPEKELLDFHAKMTEFLGLFIDEKL